MKKEVLKQTGNIKANIMKGILRAFPENSKPLVGGLGNREGDAIAYLHVGIPHESIYIIDTDSDVHKLDVKEHSLTYA
jgi:phosphatidate phosphatase PAH1